MDAAGTVVNRYAYDSFGVIDRDWSYETVPNRYAFQGREYDAERGDYHFRNRVYMPEWGLFSGPDMNLAAGPYGEAHGMMSYVFCGNDPWTYADPMGLETENQVADVMMSLMKNRTALGTAGEKVLEALLERAGHIIIKGPITNPGQHNADVITYDPKTKKINFFDNKIQTTKAAVSTANSVSINQIQTIDDAFFSLDKATHIDESTKRRIGKELNRIRTKPSRAAWFIANAAPEGVANMVSRVSRRLANSGVRLANVVGDRVVLESLAESSVKGMSRATKHFGKLTKGAAPAVIGGAITVGMAVPRLEAAAADDASYLAMMECVGGKPHFAGESILRESAVIAGEELVSEGGAYVGGAVGAPGGPWGVAGGAILGGVLGDYVGGGCAGWQFDYFTTLSPEKLSALYEEEYGGAEGGGR